MRSTPEISVIVPAYNVDKFLEESVNSVLVQTFQNIEIIIINDASDDNTGALADRLATVDRRLKVVHSKINLGGAEARNTGLRMARGRYVAFLDGDDLWDKDKLALQLATLKSTQAQICYTASQKIDELGKQFGHVQQVIPKVDYFTLLGNPLIMTSSACFDFEALGRPLMPNIRKRQDFAYWLKLLRTGASAVGINKPLTYYRVRSGSLSSNKISAARYTWLVYRELEFLPLFKAIIYFSSYAQNAFLKRLNR